MQQVVVQIFGCADSKTADMQCIFNIHDIFCNGKWTYKMNDTKFRFYSEPIDEVNKEALQIRIMMKIEELLNSERAREFICSPILRVYYDDVEKLPVVKFRDK